MNHRETGQYWDENADAWTTLSRMGYDIYRDHLNTPAFFALLPDVRGLRGLDVGCGEGHNTRLLADRGARVAAVDISPTFIDYARRAEDQHARQVRYAIASAIHLPFRDHLFDFVVGFMSFMDIPETARLLSEVYRVLEPGGFVQFSIEHPCFATPHRRNLRDPAGRTYAIEIGGYFKRLEGEVDEWLFKAAPPAVRAGLRPFRIPRFTRTLSEWINLLIDTGFTIERVVEPRPDDDTVRACPKLQDAQVVAYFLHLRARKNRAPAAGGVPA